MGNTEHALGEEHLPGCLALSQAANWNQNEADWRLMLGFGRGWGITAEDRTLAASTLILPYDGFAWIAMVLVLPEHRRKGFAARLLKKALQENSRAGRTSVLDATPAGREVYRQEGFRDTWGFKRFSLSKAFSVPGNDLKTISASDWPRILDLDRKAFGADRETVLRNLARRLPQAALVSDQGFVLAREGREATQIGPLVARDERSARELLAAALRNVKTPVYLDLLDSRQETRMWLEGLGFAIQRPFTRMVHGSGHAPGDAAIVCCPAGPELG